MSASARSATATKAWVVRRLGDPDGWNFEDVGHGEARPDMVRIEVKASAVNFFDSLQLAGTYQVKPDLPFIPGAEVAGLVLAAPPGSGFKTGERVLAMVRQAGLTEGGYTELTHSAPERTIHIPSEMPFEEAAAFFVNYQTGWVGLHQRAAVQAGEVVLVHAGAGGVGSAAIQLAKAAGATVVATAGSAAKVEVCRQMGADLAIDYSGQDFVEAVKQFTGGRGANVIYDPVGGTVFEQSTKCIAFEGRLVTVGFTSGQIPQLRANHALIKNYSLVGLHWGLYWERKPELIPEVTRQLFQLYAAGRIKPYVSVRLPLADARTALDAVASRRSTGKVVLITE